MVWTGGRRDDDVHALRVLLGGLGDDALREHVVLERLAADLVLPVAEPGVLRSAARSPWPRRNRSSSAWPCAILPVFSMRCSNSAGLPLATALASSFLAKLICASSALSCP